MTYNKTLLNSIHTPLKKSQGGGAFNGKPTVKQIMQMPDKKYAPSPAVMNTKAGLAAASMISGPFSFIPGTASAVYDLGTSARYAMDGQWENAKEDLISAGLNAIPTAGVYAALAGMGKLQKAARARAAIRSAKGAMNLKDLAGSSTIRNNMTGLVQEFDKAGKEIGSIRPRSPQEVKAYNQDLIRQYRTGATPEGPTELMPFRSPEFAKGGMPCYECGGMYAEGGYYDCPDQEKDPVTGKCSAEVARGKEAAAANKAANADMNAWAKQVAAMDKENAKQDAAQYAGQLSYDYDWMQSPVDKAEKKAAMAGYKQFFQQNPNTFVPDDTSGFSPEQKYIIASKLKQKVSTPMGSKAFKQKFNQDPNFFDLGRLQSDIVPTMGGWPGIRNWMFNNKAEGGIIEDPMGQWAHPGKNTRIPGSDITMQGVPYPVYGVGSNGQEQMMYPEQEYDFGGSSYVDEYPMMQVGGTMLNDKTNNMYFEDSNNLDMYGKGGQMIRRADGSYSKRGLWDNIRANKGSGKKPTKQMLEQEKKIKSKNYADGGTNNPGFEALPEYVQAKILSNMGFGGMTYPFMQEGGEGEEAYIPQSIEELMAPTRRGVGNFGIGFNNEKFATNYNYTGSNNLKDGTHSLNVTLPTFMKTGSLDVSGNYSPGKGYGAAVTGVAPADYIKKGAMMNFSGGFEKDTTPMMKNVAPSYNIGAGLNIPTKVGNFRVNASYRKGKGGQTNYPYMEEGGEPNGGMALGQMAAVVDKMSKLRKFVSEDENLDPWIASKLAVMDDSAAAIADYMMYNPEAQGGEEDMEEEEGNEQEEMPEMGKGGYTVTRSNDRKGKTHKVTGPDGTVKYFGDSKLGQHPKDPERKKAFYARHKKNLAGNPYFRAFARATWAEGGSTFSGNAWYGNGGTNNPGFKALPEFVQNQILSNMAYGGIHINPANEGKFTASAKAAGMGVQEFASHVLANKEDYSSTQVKRANFAHNAAGWKKAMGGPVVGQEMEVSAKELEELRKQGYQFEIL